RQSRRRRRRRQAAAQLPAGWQGGGGQARGPGPGPVSDQPESYLSDRSGRRPARAAPGPRAGGVGRGSTMTEPKFSQQQREQPEPSEGNRPVPKLVLTIIVGLFIW